MSVIALIRNSNIERKDGLPASKWGLSVDGRNLIQDYVTVLKKYKFDRLVSSHEQKAIDTGDLIANELSVSSETAYDLQEADREDVPYIASQEMFNALIEEMFFMPDEYIFGQESANDALMRFAAAIEGLKAIYPSESLAIVSHTTIISLFVAYTNEMDGYSLWQQLRTPSIVILSLNDFKILEIIEDVSLFTKK